MIKNSDRQFSNFSSEVQISTEQIENTHRKRSLFKTLSDSFDNYMPFRSKRLFVNKTIDRQFSTSFQSMRYKQRTAVYRFLQKPNNAWGTVYHMTISLIIMICIVMTILSTFDEISIVLNKALFGFDVIILTVLTIEFSFRLWACECVSQYQGWRGKVRFLSSPFRLVDIIVIITSILIVVFSTRHNNYMVPHLQWIRFFQTFKMIRLEHRFRPWPVMASVIWSQRKHLYITTYTSFLALLLTAFLIYFVEKDQNPAFSNLGDSLWWTVITLCTIGYGDIYPITTAGKFFASIAAIIGVSIFALPAGILGTGLALKVEEEKRGRQIGKRQIPAAKFIQSRWRLYRFFRNPNAGPVWTLSTSSLKQIEGQKTIFTKTERNCLKFVLKTKFFVCQRQFEQTLQPYDVKDVLEQYSTGHLEMLARIKHINHKITTVEGMSESSLKGQYETKSLINRRLGKLEDFMRETDKKLDHLLKLQNENHDLSKNIISQLMSNSTDNISKK